MAAKKNEKTDIKQETWYPEQIALMLHVSVRKIHEAIRNGGTI